MNHTETNTDAGADVGRREAAAHEALGAPTSAVSSAAGLRKVNGAPAVTTIPVPRIHYLARRIHLLGERPWPSCSSSSLPDAVCMACLNGTRGSRQRPISSGRSVATDCRPRARLLDRHDYCSMNTMMTKGERLHEPRANRKDDTR